MCTESGKLLYKKNNILHITSYFHKKSNLKVAYVTDFAKTDLMGSNTEIHFLPVGESHTHALSRDTKHLKLDAQICFFRWLFSDAVILRGGISWPVWPLRGINKTAWCAKLILMADLAYPVSCANLQLGYLLMAQHCQLCLNVCFSPPTAPHLWLPTQPHHIPQPPPTLYRLNP